MTSTTATWMALVIWLVGLVLASGLRTWAHWRATGHHGITGRAGSPAWRGGVLFPAALLLGTLGPLLALTDTLPPRPRSGTPPWSSWACCWQ